MRRALTCSQRIGDQERLYSSSLTFFIDSTTLPSSCSPLKADRIRVFYRASDCSGRPVYRPYRSNAPTRRLLWRPKSIPLPISACSLPLWLSLPPVLLSADPFGPHRALPRRE